MALYYTREVLNAISSSIAKKPLRPELWRKLTELRISQRNPTRRGRREGQRKLKTIEVCMGRRVQKSKYLSQLNSFKNSKPQEEDDLHNAILLSLNIQNDTSVGSRTNNRIVIDSSINTTRVTNPVWTPKVPTIMLANVMSLVPKMDEVSEFILRHNTNLVFTTETWLKDSVSDGVVQIPGFAVVRKDRKVIDHGGVCAYIQEGNCRYKQLKDLN